MNVKLVVPAAEHLPLFELSSQRALPTPACHTRPVKLHKNRRDKLINCAWEVFGASNVDTI
jgi:hypothetical protein